MSFAGELNICYCQDFTGLLFQDSGSNLHLNLTLLGAAGTITGQVGEEAVLVRLPPHRPANSSHTLRLGARSPCAGGEVRVSLRPLTSLGEAGTVTKTLPCVTMNMRSGFTLTESNHLMNNVTELFGQPPTLDMTPLPQTWPRVTAASPAQPRGCTGWTRATGWTLSGPRPGSSSSPPSYSGP